MTPEEKLQQLAEYFPLNPHKHGTWKLHGKGGIYTHDNQPATLELLARHVALPREDGVLRVAKPIGYLPAIIQEDGSAYTNVGMIDLDGKSEAAHKQAQEGVLQLQEIAEGLRFHRATAYEVSHSGKGYHAFIWTAQPIPFEHMAELLLGWARMADLPNAETVERFPRNHDPLSVWYRLPYAGAARDPEGTGRTHLSDIDAEPIPYGMLDQYIDPEQASESVVMTLRAAGAAKTTPQADSTPRMGDLDSGEFEKLTAPLLQPPDGFDRHHSALAALNVAERMGRRADMAAFLASDELRDAWVKDDGTRDPVKWADEIGRLLNAEEPTHGRKYGITFLKLQGFNIPRLKLRKPAAGDDGDDHSISFRELQERAQSAALADVPGILQDLRYLADSPMRNSETAIIYKTLKDATGINVTELKRDYAAMQPDEPERETLAQQLLSQVLAAGVELWHDPDGEPHITVPLDTHREHHRLKHSSVKRWLQKHWYDATGSTIGREPLTEALGVLEGMAVHDGEEHQTFIRVAKTGDGADTSIYIDMCDPAWHAIEVTASGWRVVKSEDTPVRFVRSNGMQPLPTPQPGTTQDIAEALGIPHIETDAAGNSRPSRPFQGAVAWLLQAFRVDGPFPVLPLFGQQGAGKTTFTLRLCSLLDPHSATLRVLSRDDRDTLISAQHSWIQAKDNVSSLSQWQSDTFCRLATGGAISTRTLYTDGEETILNAKRPVLLNGITNFLEQQDLVDRAIVVSLSAIPETERRPERELQAKYEQVRPRALGALLDVVATGLKRSEQKLLARMPRMADFAHWIVACCPALGWDPEDFMQWYASTKADLVREALDASVVAPYIVRLMSGKPEGAQVSFTPTELLAELGRLAGLDDGKKRNPQGWPKRAQSLTNELKRLAPALLTAEGISVEYTRDKSSRFWRLHKVSKSSSSSSPEYWTTEKARAAHASGGDDDSEVVVTASSPAVTASSPDDDEVTMTPPASSPEKHRPAQHHDDGDDDDDEKPYLWGDAEKNIDDEAEEVMQL